MADEVAWLMKLDSRIYGDYGQLVESDTWLLGVVELEAAGLPHPAEALRRLARSNERARASVFKTVFAAAEPLQYFHGVTLCA